MRNETKFLLTALTTGFGMWVVAGLWHNLILPSLFPENNAEHEGIFIGLIAYILLAGVMTYLYPFYSKKNSIRTGFFFGSLIGFLWVFPHSLALAGTHGTSIISEIQNGVYHLFEQGIGGIILVLIWRTQN
ncbi:MAG: hypothetical protein ACXAD7_23895 [Candidatus Kariarchaeaceae archaeon]|jgi:hypothetical protein